MKFNDTNLNQTNGRMCTLYIILPDKMGDYKDCFLLNSLQEFLERVEWEGCTIPPPLHKVVDTFKDKKNTIKILEALVSVNIGK